MTIEEIERAAYNGKDISGKTVEFVEYLYWLGMSNIFGMYRKGLITKEKAAQQKNELRNLFSRFNINREIYHRHIAIEYALSDYRREVEKCGCENCKKLIRLLDGRELPECYFDE